MYRWRIALIIALAVVFSVIAWRLNEERREFSGKVKTLRATSTELERENSELSGKIDYFEIPANLLKEARSRFNFTKQGEKLLIVIPGEEKVTSSER